MAKRCFDLVCAGLGLLALAPALALSKRYVEQAGLLTDIRLIFATLQALVR